MAVSVQRILIFTVALSLMFMLTNIWYHTTSKSYTSERDLATVQMQNISEEFMEQYPNTNPDAGSVYLEQQFGDVKQGGMSVWGVLGTGLGFNEAPTDADWIEKELISWLNWVVRIINLLLVLELIFMWYSKKST